MATRSMPHPFTLTIWAVFVAVLLMALTAGPVLAKKPPTPPPPTEQVTIYSDTFLPHARFPDNTSKQHYRFNEGPGSSPNLFLHQTSTGLDAFFNSPDLTIGGTPMSAVSAEVCLQASLVGSTSVVGIVFGVQDKDRNVTLAPELGVQSTTGQTCETLTFATPVMLVNHPHLETVLYLSLRDAADRVEVDGVTYTLQPTQAGDVAPGS